MEWTRPEQPVIPQTWYTFKAKDVDSDRLITYRVEDLTEDRFDDVIQHYMENFLDDEPLCQSKKVSEDELSLAEIRGFWRWCLNKRMTIACYKKGSREIVGAYLLHVKGSKKLLDAKIRGEKLKDIVATNEYMTDQYDVQKQYDVEYYLTAYGLAINQRYRGREIATEMLKVRVPLCRAFGIKVTATNFTALASQLAAAKVGFRTDLEVTYDDFAKMGPHYFYPGIKSKSLKLMSLKIE
ncbi:uncharacterized protein LOC129718108 [Wyeomyia smithii]|uniref:uncharacterized protein LOC129718108 n=1 Tax=Wyeomyia smithii TaxID=174621 RepID=UPI002467C53C|nr:uncharacterized protein LOC129718108 [Wyeomyia smithii]XP_055524505.1 uncharacterized protein LOC129718108 [Wyeomyia smithii]XP_055524506.1 uncharacterized protein LOC129718108 [Wyeomyia smithii]